jgi:hypothetical protein
VRKRGSPPLREAAQALAPRLWYTQEELFTERGGKPAFSAFRTLKRLLALRKHEQVS